MIPSFCRPLIDMGRLARQAALVAAVAGTAMIAVGAKFGTVEAADRAAPTLLGTFKDWNAYSIVEGGKTVCFAVSEPKSDKLSNPNARRGDPFFMVTRWSSEKSPQPSVLIGYPQASGSKTKITIGSKNYEMFVEGDGAWMESDTLDKELVAAMKKGASMTVVGKSGRGTVSTDKYSLSGISAAIDKITSACN